MTGCTVNKGCSITQNQTFSTEHTCIAVGHCRASAREVDNRSFGCEVGIVDVCQETVHIDRTLTNDRLFIREFGTSQNIAVMQIDRAVVF